VNVPQAYVSLIHPGHPVEVRVQELPGKMYPARVNSIANSLDTGSRSMLAICNVANPGRTLYPGMYAQVKFATPRGRSTLVVPGDTVIMSKAGPRVAVAGAGGVVHFRNITIGNDLGAEVEVMNGLSPGDLVIANPTDAIREGVRVEVRHPTAESRP